jgi:archaellum component FlaC
MMRDIIRAEISTLESQVKAVSNEVHAVSNEVHAVSNEVHAVSNEVHAVSNEVHAVSNEVHAVSQEIAPIKKALDLVLEDALDPWEKIHSETSSVAKLCDELHLHDVSSFYGMPKKHACMVLGHCTHCDIICSHIWPKSTLGKGLQSFDLTAADVNSPRNFLRLHEDIEKAFDKKYLTFLPTPGESNSLTVHVLNPEILLNPIPTSDTTHVTFADIHGREMDYRFSDDSSRRPFMRLLALHALRAFRTARQLGWVEGHEIELAKDQAFALAARSLSDESPIMSAFFRSLE